MHTNKKSFLYIVLMAVILVIFGCDRDYYPKPRGYFRIDLPERTYHILDSVYPYRFEYPGYTQLLPDAYAPDQPFWINIDYPQFRGRVHLSYKAVEGNLVRYLEDSRSLVLKHIPKASSIEETVVSDDQKRVYGITYRIRGAGAASPFQFFVTDSTAHFLRGALYFNTMPNNDSLAPVIDFIIEDIDHLINTLEWKAL